MNTETETEQTTRLMKVAPWAAGAGIAVGHILTSSNCTIPKQGLCSTCGSCVVALGSLVAWAMIKKRQGNDFYSEEKIS
ncbi:MAG: hypothetical protein Q9M50_01000 [Methylococcales bacterium]|nr:hypothetical protein [Methylococcales bacterium]